MIPSRLASTRLPKKALADIGGMPMIVHVVRQALKADLGPVIVAAGDQEIIEALEDIKGVKAILTDPNLASGSDRIYAALSQYDPKGYYESILNLQGDLPLIDPHMLQRAFEPLECTLSFDIGTVIAPIKNKLEKDSQSIVKVACAFSQEKMADIGRALYFSRASIPWGSEEGWHHIGLYAWGRDALEKFVRLPVSPLEKLEKLEQLRALEAGMMIGCACVEEPPLSVDVKEELEHVRRVYSCR